MHWFESQLLHFQSNSCYCVRESRGGRPKCLGPYTYLVDLEEAVDFGPAQPQMLQLFSGVNPGMEELSFYLSV